MYDLGHSVVGIEGVAEPIIQFFTEQKLEYHMEVIGTSPCYSVSTALPLHLFHSSHLSCIIQTEDGRLKIIHSDLFSIDPELCGKFDAVWDRGSLVAIYQEDREK